MSKAFRERYVNQSLMFPPTVHDFVPAGHLARRQPPGCGPADSEFHRVGGTTAARN